MIIENFEVELISDAINETVQKINQVAIESTPHLILVRQTTTGIYYTALTICSKLAQSNPGFNAVEFMKKCGFTPKK